MMKIFILLSTCFVLGFALASQDNQNVKVKYRKGKRIDFESLLVEGENQRAEVSIVTGNVGEKDLGLLKLRENFVDLMANDAGEEVQ